MGQAEGLSALGENPQREVKVESRRVRVYAGHSSLVVGGPAATGSQAPSGVTHPRDGRSLLTAWSHRVDVFLPIVFAETPVEVLSRGVVWALSLLSR